MCSVRILRIPDIRNSSDEDHDRRLPTSSWRLHLTAEDTKRREVSLELLLPWLTPLPLLYLFRFLFDCWQQDTPNSFVILECSAQLSSKTIHDNVAWQESGNAGKPSPLLASSFSVFVAHFTSHFIQNVVLAILVSLLPSTADRNMFCEGTFPWIHSSFQ